MGLFSSFSLGCSSGFSRRRSQRYAAYLLAFILSITFALGSLAPALAQNSATQARIEPRTVTWEDLQSRATQLRNPYAHLTTAQTYRLSNLYQLREWIETNQPEPDSFERQELQRLEESLAADGIEATELLKEVEAAQAYWTAKSRTTNADITEHPIALDGYVLPLGGNPVPNGEQAPEMDEFLLVPYVGACIHVPAPPPNQMVYIKTAEAIKNPGMFSAVQVKGTLQAQAGSYELFQVDGSRTVDVSYAMSLSALAPTDNQPVAPSPTGGSLLTLAGWKALPAQISGTLTTALSQIQRQNSPRALFFALLLAFSYGVLHTLGPGHGKAVIVSYFVGQGGSLQRGLFMGGQIAVFHVLSATLLVVFTDTVVRQIGGVPAGNYRVVQLISYGAIALLGGWMLRQTLASKARPQSRPPSRLPSTALRTDLSANDVLYPSLSQQLRNHQKSDKQDDWMACSCAACDGSASMSNWLALAVGAVPCSGALLVLLYGLANDMLWQSVAMVVAISAGMALTLAWIGVMAILTHRWGNQMAQRRRDNQKKSKRSWALPIPLTQMGRIIGASCVCLLGISLFTLTWMTGA
ncbi:MAG: DUF3299 domain-containing protein [Cyanobacteria bacterium P01_D01_bin.105]